MISYTIQLESLVNKVQNPFSFFYFLLLINAISAKSVDIIKKYTVYSIINNIREKKKK